MPIFKTGNKVVYYAHVPKCAGSSIEDYLTERFGPVSFLNRKYSPNRRRNWSASSPQHILAKDLEKLFAREFFDAGFAVVRAPLKRFISAFHYHREQGERIAESTTINEWIAKVQTFDMYEHRKYDNHFLPQTAFVPSWCKAFRLEDGLGHVETWLDQISGQSVAASIPDTFKGGYAETTYRDEFISLVEGLYHKDYERFGYERVSAPQAPTAQARGLFDVADLSSTDISDDALGKIGQVGVFVHVFYEDMLEGMMQEIRKLPISKAVYISTTTKNNLDYIKSVAPEAEVRAFDNRGRDIWPKVWGFADKYSQHQVVLHLHTKKSLHDKRLKNWSGHIFSSLLDPDRSREIVGRFASDPAVGIIAPAIPEVTQPYCTWRRNYKAARKIARRLGVQVHDDGAQFAFPAGSMFWARSEIPMRLAKLDLPQDYFPPESGQKDGTPAHAVERMFGVLAKAMSLDLLYV